MPCRCPDNGHHQFHSKGLTPCTAPVLLILLGVESYVPHSSVCFIQFHVTLIQNCCFFVRMCHAVVFWVVFKPPFYPQRSQNLKSAVEKSKARSVMFQGNMEHDSQTMFHKCLRGHGGSLRLQLDDIGPHYGVLGHLELVKT